LFRDEKGVSPVIGVVLMVALAVIMAAVTASFTAGVGKITRSIPRVYLAVADDPYISINSNGNYTLVKVSHKGGDVLKVSELDVVVTNTTTGNALRMSEQETNIGMVKYSFTDGNISDYKIMRVNIKPGDVFYIAVNGTIMGFNGSGFCEVKIIHKPTGQLIVDAQVYCH